MFIQFMYEPSRALIMPAFVLWGYSVVAFSRGNHLVTRELAIVLQEIAMCRRQRNFKIDSANSFQLKTCIHLNAQYFPLDVGLID